MKFLIPEFPDDVVQPDIRSAASTDICLSAALFCNVCSISPTFSTIAVHLGDDGYLTDPGEIDALNKDIFLNPYPHQVMVLPPDLVSSYHSRISNATIFEKLMRTYLPEAAMVRLFATAIPRSLEHHEHISTLVERVTGELLTEANSDRREEMLDLIRPGEGRDYVTCLSKLSEVYMVMLAQGFCRMANINDSRFLPKEDETELFPFLYN